MKKWWIGVIILILYLLSYFSLINNWDILYPYYYIKDLAFLPVLAIDNNKDLVFSNNYYSSILLEKEKEINELKKLKDISVVNSEYNIINATVISRNRLYWFNTLTINKGEKDGLALDMAVVNEDGLIGRISKVNPLTSEIKLLTTNDVNSKISIVINHNNNSYYGIINGYDSENNVLLALLMDKNIDLKGEKVLTTGMGGVFPSGILIGTVKDNYLDQFEVGLKVEITPSVDIKNIKFVSVLKR